ncbi:MAG: riboflavin kinase [Angelakisella sp.]
MTVTLCHFLRPERRFPDVEALRQAIAQNAREARTLLLGEGKEEHTPCDQ